MSLATYEPRTLPSVFTDVHSHREVQAAKEEVQKARARAGRMWIWILLILGILIAVGIGAAWAYGQFQNEHRRAENLNGQLQALETQQADFANLSQRRENLARVRTDLAANIDFIRRRNPQAAQRVTTAAQNAWLAEDRRLAALERRQPTYPPLQLTPQSQRWSEVLSFGNQELEREANVMQAVSTAVDNAIARESGVSGPTGPVCNPVTGANCRRTP
jgi:hypothetical protein